MGEEEMFSYLNVSVCPVSEGLPPSFCHIFLPQEVLRHEQAHRDAKENRPIRKMIAFCGALSLNQEHFVQIWTSFTISRRSFLGIVSIEKRTRQ